MSQAGGAMADAFINLGDRLHNNFSGNMVSAWQNRNNRQNREEDKRQFDLGMLLKKAEMNQNQDQFDRGAGMSAINYLAGERSKFMPNMYQQQLKDAYFRG